MNPQQLAEQAAQLLRQGRAREAEQLYQQILAATDTLLASGPRNAPAHFNRGAVLRQLGRLSEALAAFDQALALSPGLAAAHAARGDVLRQMTRFAQALESYDRALALAPDSVALLNDRGAVLQSLRRRDEALQSYGAALRLAPDFTDALFNRGHLLWRESRREEALADLERLARLAPDHDYLPGDLLHLRLELAQWQDYDQQRDRIDQGVRAGKRVVRPFAYQAVARSPADSQAASVIYAGDRYPATAPPQSYARKAGGKIRLGYMSGEFRDHAAAFLMAGLYEHHDKNRFEITAFDTGGNVGGVMRPRLEAAFDKFVDLSRLDDAAAAQTVRAAEIDILVNLNGYFGNQRMGVFARRPAPLQVNYLGFPGTLGVPYMDYILADRVVIPEGERRFYTEQVVWLPDSYFVNDSKRQIADTAPSRAACGLPEQGFVFCNFNHIYKLTPAIFAVWMNILRQVQGSVLWLMQSNQASAERLRAQAQRHGVAGGRLIFAGPVRVEEHLARIKCADLFLDGLPYNAHTTGSDSLWAGVPLLTCRGTTFPGRVAASLLHAIGLPELVTESLEDYQALALALAGDPARLEVLRQKLADNRTTAPLFDTARFCRHIEAAYIRMRDIHARGEKAQSFGIDAL